MYLSHVELLTKVVGGVRWWVVEVEYRTGHPDYQGGRHYEAYNDADPGTLIAGVPASDYRGDFCAATFVDDVSEASPDDDTDAEWRREQAMQAGMAGGCEAYNEAMGWEVGE